MIELNIGQFNPKTQRDRDRNRQMFYTLTGEAGREIRELITAGKQVPKETEDRANQHFLNVFPDLVGLPAHIPPQRFWGRREEEGLRLHRLITKQLPSLTTDLELTTDPRLEEYNGQITPYLEVLNGDNPRRLKHEKRRELLLGLTSAMIEGQDLTYGLTGQLAHIKEILNSTIFPEGTNARPFTVRAHHDAETNKVLDVQAWGARAVPENSILRVHTLPVRKVDNRNISRVYYHSRTKGSTEAIGKAMDRALKSRTGQIDPEVDVQDRLGLMFVLMNPKTKPESMHQVLLRTLEEHYGTIPWELDINTDGYKNGDHNPLEWTRYKYFPSGFHFPLEVIIFRTNEYLDYHNELGSSLDPKSIKARSIYQIYRIGQVMAPLYPVGLGLYRYDIDRAVREECRYARDRILRSGLAKENAVRISGEDIFFAGNAKISDLTAR